MNAPITINTVRITVAGKPLKFFSKKPSNTVTAKSGAVPKVMQYLNSARSGA